MSTWTTEIGHIGSTKPNVLLDGEPCPHLGCLSHITHPCEGCGRVGGRRRDAELEEAAGKLSDMIAMAVAAEDEWLKKPEAERHRPKDSYWEMAMPTFMENWPSELHSLSIPSVGRRLMMSEARTLGSYILELGEAFEKVPENREEIRARLIDALDKQVKIFPQGVFVRLGSRSPKDALYWGVCDTKGAPENGRLVTGEQVFGILTACSERIYDDLQMQIAMEYPPSIWLRQGLELPEWSEFRCFMQDRKLIGISQYYYRTPYKEIAEDAGGIKWAIECFFNSLFQSRCHLDSMVFDVFVKRRGTQSCLYEVKLLEINPFFPLTDPCLFDWNKPDDFKGQLRFRQELGGHRHGVVDV
jgi:hypothetical protein